MRRYAGSTGNAAQGTNRTTPLNDFSQKANWLKNMAWLREFGEETGF